MECTLEEHITTLSFTGDESMMEMGSGDYGYFSSFLFSFFEKSLFVS